MSDPQGRLTIGDFARVTGTSVADGIDPELAFDIARPDQPVVVRSADTTGVMTLLMRAPCHPGTTSLDTTGAA